MAEPWLAWLVWDVLTAVLVLVFALAPVLAVGVAVYVVMRWRKNGAETPEPSTTDDAEPL